LAPYWLPSDFDAAGSGPDGGISPMNVLIAYNKLGRVGKPRWMVAQPFGRLGTECFAATPSSEGPKIRKG